MEEKDIERGLPVPNMKAARLEEKDPDIASTGSSSDSLPVFEPIHTTTNRRPSRDTTRSNKTTAASLRRNISSNGYGCDNPVDSADFPDVGVDDISPSPQDDDDEKDAFEVGWDGPDDPENPRNMSKGKKWAIIGITSFGSFIV